MGGSNWEYPLMQISAVRNNLYFKLDLPREIDHPQLLP